MAGFLDRTIELRNEPMLCSYCGAKLIGAAGACGACGRSALPGAAVAVTILTPPPVSSESSATSAGPASSPGTPGDRPDTPVGPTASPPFDGPTVLPPPTDARPGPQPRGVSHLRPGPFGRRYHLIRLLGEGGMGAVYQAWDEELGVVVAIKVIRPEAMSDPAAARDMERRFKRELVLARNVTHKNVVRIHDLGEIDGIKYITMPYVNGEDLATVLQREGALPVARALKIARQIASGLVAAHEAGVIHRDLKPANILLDEEDHALITDFGIARSASGPGGGTVAGAVVGTLEYMAPEQARAGAVDHRADLYAFGLILADMLIGLREAVRAESAVAELLHRLTHGLPSIRSINQGLPQTLDDIVARCVQPDPGHRYQRTDELLADVEKAAAGQTGSRTAPAPVAPPVRRRVSLSLPATNRVWALLGGSAIVFVLATGAVVFRDRISWIVSGSPDAAPAPAANQVSLLVLPFRNASGDRSLDSLGPALAAMLRTEMGHAAALRTVPGNRVAQILSDLRIAPDANVEPSMLRSLAEFSGANTVVWGQYVRFGDEIRIDATLQDLKANRIVPLKESAANEPAILQAVDRLAASVRSNLALSSEAVADLAASAWTPSSNSVRALRDYNEGVEAARQGRGLDAAKSFQAATQEDGDFALAWSGLAQAYAATGRMTDAEKTSRRAVELSSALPRQERSLILATHARLMNDAPKAIEYFEELHQTMPGSDEVEFSLASLYKEEGEFDKARALFAGLLERDPKYLDGLLGAGEVESWSGRSAEALDYLNRALTIAVQRGNDEAKARVLLALGSAYGLLNKLDEALQYCQESLAIERRLERTAGIARSLHVLGQIRDQAGQSDALESYREALELSRRIGDRQAVGNILNDLGTFHAVRGQYEEALPQFRAALQAQREVRNQVYEAMALNNIGTIYMSLGRYDDAQTYLQQALTLRERINVPSDTADTLHNLAEVSLRTGAYDAALRQYLAALELRRQIGDERGTAIEQYHLGTLYGYEGRYGAAVEAKADAVRIFEKIDAAGVWLPKVLASYGSALHQVGRGEEAERTLEEALRLAQPLRSDELVVQISLARGDGAYYRGDFGSARHHYTAAEALAGRAGLEPQQLTARLNLARITFAEGRAPVAPATLQRLGAEAEGLGLKFEAVQAALLAAEADLRARRHADAREQVDATLAHAERLGARALLAHAHHLAAVADAALGHPADARRHTDRTRQLLDAIRSDAREDAVLQRYDLRQIVQAAR